MINLVPLTVNPVAEPDRDISSGPSSKSSSTVVKSKVASPLIWLAGMVTVKSFTAVKSAASAPWAPPAPATDTVTAVAEERAVRSA